MSAIIAYPMIADIFGIDYRAMEEIDPRNGINIGRQGAGDISHIGHILTG
jgi:hypothetical protein